MALARDRLRAPEFPDGLVWLGTPRPLRLADLRGRFVLLDFWTYGCVNCLHVLPDLDRLATEFADVLTVIGVHSAKFAGEGDAARVASAMARLGVHHPVVSDPEYAVWERYAVKAWPTLVLVGPDGYIAAQRSGEGAYAPFAEALRALAPRFEAAGTLLRGPGPAFEPAAEAPRDEAMLRFPGKVHAFRDRLFVADTGHHRIVVASADGRVERIVGGSEPGFEDGSFEGVRFRAPQGLWHDPASERLFVCDAGNHALRVVDFERETVSTLAGVGAQAPWGAAESGPGQPLNTPWDVAMAATPGEPPALFVAMAGPHQLWRFDAVSGEGAVFAGTGEEHLVDGPRLSARLAQPSGVATHEGNLYFVDAESSALRRVPLGEDGAVETLVGAGLFSFGHRDGGRDEARLQHPLGVAAGAAGVFVADTYNGAVRCYSPATGVLTTLATGLSEPGGLALTDDPARGDAVLVVADTNAHALRRIDLATGHSTALALTAAPAPAASALPVHALPAQRLVPGPHTLVLDLRLPDGFHLNDLDPGTFDAVATGPSTVTTPPRMPVGEFNTFGLLVAEGEASVVIDGRALLCTDEDGEASLCVPAPFRLRLPVVGAADGREASAPLEVSLDAPG